MREPDYSPSPMFPKRSFPCGAVSQASHRYLLSPCPGPGAVRGPGIQVGKQQVTALMEGIVMERWQIGKQVKIMGGSD